MKNSIKRKNEKFIKRKNEIQDSPGKEIVRSTLSDTIDNFKGENTMKKIIAMLLVIMISITTTISVNAQSTLTVIVDGAVVNFPDAKPYIDSNNRTLVPIRFVTEALGADVEWNQGSQEATITLGDVKAVLKIGEKTIKKGNTTIQMDTVAILKDNRTFVPARFVAEAFGASVGYDKPSNTVIIITNKNNPVTYDKVLEKVENTVVYPSP